MVSCGIPENTHRLIAKSKLILFLLLFGFAFNFSCENDDILNQEIELTNDSYSSHTIVENDNLTYQDLNSIDSTFSREQVLLFSQEDQKQYWLNRLNNYLSIDLEEIQKVKILEIKTVILEQDYNQFYLSEQLRVKAIELANITPEVDFLTLFVNFDAVPILQKSGEICYTCIADLEAFKNYDDSEDPPVNGLPNCTCRYTCDQAAIEPCDRVTSKCNQVGGCGFFGFQACTGAIESTGICGD